MGIYLPNMEMPKTPVLFCVHPDGKVFADLEGNWREYKAVPVPPHGRCIDADALMARFEKEEKAADEHGRDFSFSFKSGGENCTEWWPVQQMLMDAPTIIEAEEGE